MVVETELRREEYGLENKDEPFPIDPLTREIERKRHLENIYFTMLVEEPELVELDTSFCSHVCVICDGINVCAACAEISACLNCKR